MAQKIYGNNLVFCKGRFIGGPDARSCVASLIMIFAPSVVWLVEVGIFLADRYSAALTAFGVLLHIASLGLLLATAFSDPGIMPRQKEYTQHYDIASKAFRTKQPPRYYDLILRGHPFKLKYCITCNIYRPPRCTHCSVCENCIERFDHHCPWIGNCVGKRNYWLFYSFVSATGALNTFSLATAVAQLAVLCQDHSSLEGVGGGEALVRAMRDKPLSAALVVYCVAIVWFTVGLCVYHNYLICTNQTTYEQIKGVYCTGHNPFHRGVIGNYADVLFSRVRQRYFNAHTGELFWPSATCEAIKDMKSSSLPADPRGVDSPGADVADTKSIQDVQGSMGAADTESRKQPGQAVQAGRTL